MLLQTPGDIADTDIVMSDDLRSRGICEVDLGCKIASVSREISGTCIPLQLLSVFYCAVLVLSSVYAQRIKHVY